LVLEHRGRILLERSATRSRPYRHGLHRDAPVRPRPGGRSMERSPHVEILSAMAINPPSGATTASGMTNERELELLRLVVGHDRAAFKELYLTYHRSHARFLMRMTSHHELIEEIINDTLWTVWQKAGDFRGASRVSTWIVGI